MILLIVSSFLFSRQFVLEKERPDDRENLRKFIRQADNKNISWVPVMIVDYIQNIFSMVNRQYWIETQ